MSKQLATCRRQIDQIKEELLAIGDMRPGSLSEQYNVCGKPNCRCKDKEQPRKHGPYYQLSYTHAGKGHTEFVSSKNVDAIRLQLDAYARFRELTDHWVALALQIAGHRKKIMRNVKRKSQSVPRKP